MKSTAAPKTKRGLARREALLEAAERVFGRDGFSAASIASITGEAGTALGTFYIYFGGKAEAFRELVLMMGQMTRAVINRAVAAAPDRLTAERDGLAAFLRFVAERPTLYRIVEEARFVDPEAYRAYYSAFAAAYAEQLRDSADRGDVSAGDPEIRAWALMGIAKALGERYVLWAEAPDFDRVVDEAFGLIRDGLAP